MARHIDDSKPLSDEDRQWLTDWSRTAEIERIDALHNKSEGQPDGQVLFDNLRPLQSGSDHSGEQEEPEDPEKGEPPTFANLSAPQGDTVEAKGDWYEDEGITKEDLQDELGERELSKSGTKQELIERLREDDAAKA
jgi:hypothetical protein